MKNGNFVNYLITDKKPLRMTDTLALWKNTAENMESRFLQMICKKYFNAA